MIGPALEKLLATYRGEIFTPPAVELYRLIDRYAAGSSLSIAERVGIRAGLDAGRSVEPLLDEAGIHPKARALVRRVAQILAAYGLVGRAPGGRIEEFDLARLRAEGLGREPSLEPAFLMVDRVREQALPFSLGEVEGNALRAEVHAEFFLRCPIGNQTNRWGGEVVRALLESLGRPAAILEIGAGTGSGAIGVLDALARDGSPGRVALYVFSELNPFFVLDARKRFPASYPGVARFAFSFLNYDRPFQDPAIPAGELDVVYGTNCLHTAKDLPFTLAEIRRVLRPGGHLVQAQFVRATDADPLPFVDLICDPLESYWDVKVDPATRPVHGLLSAGAWRRSLAAAGFQDVRILPDESNGPAWFDPKYSIGVVVARNPGA